MAAPPFRGVPPALAGYTLGALPAALFSQLRGAGETADGEY